MTDSKSTPYSSRITHALRIHYRQERLTTELPPKNTPNSMLAKLYRHLPRLFREYFTPRSTTLPTGQKYRPAWALLLLYLTGCNGQLPSGATSNDYPTMARVEFVLQCMQYQGGQTYDTLYPCVCTIDTIAKTIAYNEYVEAQTFTYLKSTPGEAGGLFRDPPRAKELRERMQEAEKDARTSCFVKPK